jgi:hypothetical protein
MVEFDEVYSTKKTIRDGLASKDISYKDLCLEIIRDNIERFNYPLYSVEVYNIKKTIRDALASVNVDKKNYCFEVVKEFIQLNPPPLASALETSSVFDEDPVSS